MPGSMSAWMRDAALRMSSMRPIFINVMQYQSVVQMRYSSVGDSA